MRPIIKNKSQNRVMRILFIEKDKQNYEKGAPKSGG
jgi:hypothetical protein